MTKGKIYDSSRPVTEIHSVQFLDREKKRRLWVCNFCYTEFGMVIAFPTCKVGKKRTVPWYCPNCGIRFNEWKELKIEGSAKPDKVVE